MSSTPTFNDLHSAFVEFHTTLEQSRHRHRNAPPGAPAPTEKPWMRPFFRCQELDPDERLEEYCDRVCGEYEATPPVVMVLRRRVAKHLGVSPANAAFLPLSEFWDACESLCKLRTDDPGSSSGQAAVPGALEAISDEPLSHRAQHLLIALHEMNALDSDSRKSNAEVTARALGPIADPNAQKRVWGKLRKAKYVESKEGSGGGYWLTETGAIRARRLVESL